MGYGLSRISPITFNDDAFQMPNNRVKNRVPTSTPRRKRNEANDIPTTEAPQQDGNTKSHNTNLLISNAGSNELVSRFVPSQPNNTGSPSQETDSSNTTTVYYYKKSNGGCQDKCVSIQMSPKNTVSTGTATAMQTADQKALQVEGTQTTPPSSPRKPTSMGETQTSPSRDEPHRQLGQVQLDHRQECQLTSATTGQGKKTKKSSTEALPHPGPSTGPPVGLRNDFSSRNLGTSRPTIQCTACGKYSHWRRECLYDNYCTTCENHDHATHMCRAWRQATNNKGQQGQRSPQICIHCGSMEHNSSNCWRRPWSNREQPHGTPKSLRRDQPANPHVPGRSALMGANTGHDSRNRNFDYRELWRQPHTRFNERYNQKYSPPLFPPTPSLNNSFLEGLSKSLLQIADNQSKMIEAMKASQEV